MGFESPHLQPSPQRKCHTQRILSVQIRTLPERGFIGSESGSFGLNLYCSVVAEVACALLSVLGTPNAARFITIMTSANRYSPIVNPIAACIAKIQPSQIQRVLFNQMKTG